MMPVGSVTFSWPHAKIGRFAALLAMGVGIATQTGINLYDFLCDQLGLKRDYVDHSIQTIFVDGHAVDSLERVAIGQGTIIALSAAMPGLAGATLRKGGHFAGMRREISHRGTAAEQPITHTVVTLKLFNLVFRDVAPLLLAKGVWVNGLRMKSLLADWSDAEFSAASHLRWNHQKITPSDLIRRDWTDDWVAMRIEILT